MIQSRLHKPKINIITDENYKIVRQIVHESYLNTVCAEARCLISMNVGIEKRQP